MESLALLVSIIVLLRVTFVSLCVALTIYYLNWTFVDGVLQRRTGLPTSLVFQFGLFFALGVLLVLLLSKLLS